MNAGAILALSEWRRRLWTSAGGAEEYAYGKHPNDFLEERVGVLPSGGSVLCLAEGEGRNAVYLAKAGHAVTGVDLSEGRHLLATCRRRSEQRCSARSRAR